ncbi:hypothetical protein FUAX_47980 (plasmid) [Fulvitalea axinellae]|uniref:Uncharacterized protein n=1 Tax=Fulvitalea axinellae TaxID=1182444 RepID=A0AAU9CJS7_9BACT|nr:hypothetical protein FUAX_47980 [Fulvitalea axinellae]
MIAGFLMISEDTLESLMPLGPKDLSDRIIEIEENPENENMDIDKLWDILHAFLTGVSASKPIEGDRLSEAIVGTHPFSYESHADFITCTEHDELPEIIHSMEYFDWEVRKKEFNLKEFGRKRIYPTGICKEDPKALIPEMEKPFDRFSNSIRKRYVKNGI